MRMCPQCSGLVDDSSASCPFCGRGLTAGGTQAVSTQPTYSGYGSRTCVACGRAIQSDANVCSYCGHDYRVPLGMSIPARRTWKPVVGGVLIIIAGLFAVAMAVLMMSLEESDIDELEVQMPEGYTVEEFLDIAGTCGIIVVAFAALAIIGGIFGVLRKKFALAVIGGIFGLLGVGFVIGSVLGLVGLILVALSREEFG